MIKRQCFRGNKPAPFPSNPKHFFFFFFLSVHRHAPGWQRRFWTSSRLLPDVVESLLHFISFVFYAFCSYTEIYILRNTCEEFFSLSDSEKRFESRKARPLQCNIRRSVIWGNILRGIRVFELVYCVDSVWSTNHISLLRKVKIFLNGSLFLPSLYTIIVALMRRGDYFLGTFN